MRRNLPAYASEFAGTALMFFVGVSAVALMWAPASPVPVVENGMLRRLLTGIVVAGGAIAVVYSSLGQPAAATELLRQLARRVEATNERIAGRA